MLIGSRGDERAAARTTATVRPNVLAWDYDISYVPCGPDPGFAGWVGGRSGGHLRRRTVSAR
jgi:hypothetical protein